MAKDPETKDARLHHALALLGPGIVLISGHALFYDFGIVLLGYTATLKVDNTRSLIVAILINWAAVGMAVASHPPRRSVRAELPLMSRFFDNETF